MERIDKKIIDNYELLYEMYFYKELAESEEDIKQGRTLTLNELDREMEAKYASYSQPKS